MGCSMLLFFSTIPILAGLLLEELLL
ncbi:MAG: hypothetical protein EZS28_014849, partial [Streblomastix strix]